ncbi:histidine phosphatase family protein [Rickettsiella massiliensis]|uniref:histidine phosphatase family protein n=1 Tax=Rickettsiella massiliensis TaxID=676517 RepID=UPI00029B29B1|nr:histidine phosphatase family protein [Rickettsiella massiliensis]
MHLILSRHGNTFEPSQPAVWVGAQQDLPLVTAGVEQAQRLAHSLRETNITLHGVYCAPLKRTKDYAQIVVESLDHAPQPIVDSRLIELDYGRWTGLSSQQIKEQGQGEALLNWEKQSQWPLEAGWGASEAEVIEQTHAFAEDLRKKHAEKDTLLVVASNGCLRYFLHLIPGAFAQHVRDQNFKVATGQISLLTYTQGKWQLVFWNKKPEQLLSSRLSSPI